MPYIIDNSNGDQTITIADETLNQDFSIDLVGRNYANYGAVIAESFLHILENFATDSTTPTNPTDGQLWYEKGSKALRVYDSTTGSWLPVRDLVSSTDPANTFGQNKAGTSYYNTTVGQSYTHDGTAYRLSNVPGEISDAYSGNPTLDSPAFYGTTLRNIYLTDTSSVPRAVLALVYTNTGSHPSYYNGEKIIAIMSGHTSSFEADNVNSSTLGASVNYYAQLNEAGGIGTTIEPGWNFRADDSTKTNFAGLADRAEAAYNLNTGSYGADGANISASNVFHAGADSVPSSTDTWDLGEANTVFSSAYISNVFLGNGTTGSILPNGNSVVTIGSNSSPINNIFTTDITVQGNINFPAGNGSIGDANTYLNVAYIDNIFANNVTIDGYTLPTSAGTAAQQIYSDGAGGTLWANPASNIHLVNADPGITITRSTDSFLGGNIIPQDTVFVGLDVSYARGILSGGANIDYDANTGVIALDLTTNFEGLDPTDFVRVVNNQSVAGTKTFTDQVVLTDGIRLTTLGEIDFVGLSDLTIQGTSGNVVIDSNGNLTANDLIGTFTTPSDARLKENVAVIKNASEIVSKLQGVTYTEKSSGKELTGVIAQNVLEEFPPAVNQAGEYLGVYYGNMVGLLIEAHKEQQAEIAALRQEIENLKKGNN